MSDGGLDQRAQIFKVNSLRSNQGIKRFSHLGCPTCSIHEVKLLQLHALSNISKLSDFKSASHVAYSLSLVSSSPLKEATWRIGPTVRGPVGLGGCSGILAKQDCQHEPSGRNISLILTYAKEHCEIPHREYPSLWLEW
jgi:hypothetical protein